MFLARFDQGSPVKAKYGALPSIGCCCFKFGMKYVRHVTGSRSCQRHTESCRIYHQRHRGSCSKLQASLIATWPPRLCILFWAAYKQHTKWKSTSLLSPKPCIILNLSSNCRYGLLVYNGSVHYWHMSRVLQREGLRCHLLPSEQTVVDAVRKLPDKQSWLSCLLLQLALGQLEVIADSSTTTASS